jgi:hypothetical protein
MPASLWYHVICLLAVAAVMHPATTVADDAPERRRMGEPLLVESTTDIDAEESGEVEVDVLAGHTGRGFAASAEVEWRATTRLGLAAEVDGGSEVTDNVNARAAVAWAILHDYERDLHAQAFLRVRLPFDFERAAPLDPVDSALPLTAGVHGAFRHGMVNVRGEFGVEAGPGGPSPVSVRGAAALLLDGSIGFVGVDVMGDLARPSPWAIAPEAVLASTGLGLPLRVGVALPVTLSASRNVGVVLGIVAELK